MARDITVHKGYSVNGLGQERPSAWVETSIDLKPEWVDLANGLGSKYFRNESIEDDERESDRPASLPRGLTQRQILAIYRTEFAYWGINLPTWADSLTVGRTEQAVEWLKELVVGAFPEMKEYAR